MNIRLCAAALTAAALMGACSNSQKGAADSDSAVADTIDITAEQNAQIDSLTAAGKLPYTAEFFMDEANKGSAGEKDKWAVTPSGLKYAVITEGTGNKPASDEAVVTVHYAGELTDGTSFDSSYTRGEPTTFPLNRVIKGWTEGLQLMPVGSVYEFYIPSNLAYGEQGGGGGVIPPNAPLLFKVQLIEVK